ncbi:hypothetical protein OU995_12710 [Roseateles sp. SL47]|jgi:predicted  nucleic acid-binding Zn-ribbon protein|uniref:hypothetical protein n=1 Tax=Roseateles sp. SL47 TaxID=2995138 RepID=UPI00226E3156|nr:hypothetical protein [Roseateles sp. SL47]WAC75504.1 hypothetical protein OU995_12710 [Roseateles sp. SL47]
MKHTLRTTAAVATLLACGLAFAQTSTTAPKADPKNAKVTKPVVDKPKQKLMTRDELRACLLDDKSLTEENTSLKAKEKDILAERDALKAFKAEQDKAEAEMQNRSKELKAEIEAVNAFAAEIQAGAAKMEKDQLKAKQEEYQARANTLQPKIDAFNKERNDRVEKYKGFNDRVDAQAKSQDDFNEAVETLQDKRDEWKKRCANKPYDEADEVALKKELGIKK